VAIVPDPDPPIEDPDESVDASASAVGIRCDADPRVDPPASGIDSPGRSSSDLMMSAPRDM
jgi:hypothetical protein